MGQQIKPFLRTHKWFLLAALLLLCSLVYTAIFATGVLLYPTLYLERFLVQRPLTSTDCVLRGWSRFGQADASVLLTLALGVVCLLLGYRKRVLPYLILLLLLGVGIEVVGKQVFPQPVPGALHAGLLSLQCPQMDNKPRSLRLELTVGMWWEAPPISHNRVKWAHEGATAPLTFDDDTRIMYGYPSGHALRFSFLGLVACWLVSRHIKRRILRSFLMALTLIIAIGGGFTLFYLAYHLITDVVAGYLLGIAAACLAIGLLQRNQPRRTLTDREMPSETARIAHMV